MEKLKFVIPNNSHKVKAQEYIEEFKIYNSNINGSGNLEKYNDYEKWLEFLNEISKPKNGDIPRSTLNNIASEKNIKHNGGIYWNKIDTKCEGKDTQRYWIYI